MADQEQLESLLDSAEDNECEVWNEWREEYFFIKIDLSKADLAKADLREADLKEVDLKEADLTGADLTEAEFNNAELTEAELTGANLSKAYLSDSVLKNAYLMEANLREAKLIDANLQGANLTRTDLTRSDLTTADLTDAIFIGANLIGANLMGANLSGANLSHANMCNCLFDSETNFEGANMTKAYIDEVSFAQLGVNKGNLTDEMLRTMALDAGHRPYSSSSAGQAQYQNGATKSEAATELLNDLQDEIRDKFRIDQLEEAIERSGPDYEEIVPQGSGFSRAIRKALRYFRRQERLAYFLKQLKKQNPAFDYEGIIRQALGTDEEITDDLLGRLL